MSFDDGEALVRMYVLRIGPNQTFAHPEIPADSTARPKNAHGEGEGELVIDFDRLAERTFWMTVRSRAVLSLKDGGAERNLTVERTFRYEADRD